MTTAVESSSNFFGLAAAATTLASVIGVGYFMKSQDSKKHNKPFHMKYKAPASPFIIRLIALGPKFIRQKFGCLVNAPHEPLQDARTLGIDPNASVYRKEVVVPEKIWRVGYTFQSELIPLFKEVLAQTYTDDDAKSVVENAPPHLRTIVKADTEMYSKLWCMDCKDAKQSGDYLKLGATDLQFMSVVKLNSGGLLLYSPIRIHDDLKEWIDSLGDVKWIVLGSSGHTTNLKGIIEQYPEAKVVGQEDAEMKLRATGLKKQFDYISEIDADDDSRSISNAVVALQKENVELISIKGDSLCHAICLLSEGVLMECDLAYGYHTGNHVCFCAPESEEAITEWETSDDLWFCRHFYYHQLHKTKSPNGYLPDYRFQTMDWNDPLLRSFGGECNPEDCQILYETLQNLVNRNDYTQVVGVHFRHVLTGDNFKKSIDKCWNWLVASDGDTEYAGRNKSMLLSSASLSDDHDSKGNNESTTKRGIVDKVMEGTKKLPNA